MRERTAKEHGLTVDEYSNEKMRQRMARQRNRIYRSLSQARRKHHDHDPVWLEGERRKHSKKVSQSVTQRYHSDPEFRDRVIATAHSRKASKLGLGGVKVTMQYLGERDGWRCGICGKRIRDRKQASPDHIVPLSKGGEHSLENLQITHRQCNLAKGNRGGGEQLILIG